MSDPFAESSSHRLRSAVDVIDGFRLAVADAEQLVIRLISVKLYKCLLGNIVRSIVITAHV